MTAAPDGRVLVVEDEAAIARLLRVELGASGFDVILAGDGDEALVVALADPPDVVVADVMMPRMDGFELIRSRSGPSAPAWSSTAGGASPGRGPRHGCHPAPESTNGLHLRG